MSPFSRWNEELKVYNYIYGYALYYLYCIVQLKLKNLVTIDNESKTNESRPPYEKTSHGAPCLSSN